MTWTAPKGWRRIRQQVFDRYGRQCWRCGRYATTVDHLTPVALGGGHDLANLRPSCRRCNYSTGAALGNRIRGQRRHQAPAYQAWPTARRW